MENSEVQPVALLFGIIAFFAFFSAVMNATNGGNEESSVSISPKSFSFKAPIGFVIGFAALFMAFLTNKLDSYFDNNSKVQQLELEVEKVKHRKDGVFQERFKERSPKSIFGGVVLVEYNWPYIKFSGIRGIRENNSTGKWYRNAIRIDDGTRFYIMCSDNTKWGVNTLKNSTGSYVILEFYPVK